MKYKWIWKQNWCIFFYLIKIACKYSSTSYRNWFFIELFGLGFENEATFTLTRQGYSKLVHDGFSYQKKRVANGITYWRCVKFQRTKCTGKAQTKRFRSKHMVQTYAPHNHQPDEEWMLYKFCYQLIYLKEILEQFIWFFILIVAPNFYISFIFPIRFHREGIVHHVQKRWLQIDTQQLCKRTRVIEQSFTSLHFVRISERERWRLNWRMIWSLLPHFCFTFIQKSQSSVSWSVFPANRCISMII